MIHLYHYLKLQNELKKKIKKKKVKPTLFKKNKKDDTPKKLTKMSKSISVFFS